VVLDTVCLCYWANAAHQAEDGFTTGQDFQSMTLLVSSICVSSTPLFQPSTCSIRIGLNQSVHIWAFDSEYSIEQPHLEWQLDQEHKISLEL